MMTAGAHPRRSDPCFMLELESSMRKLLTTLTGIAAAVVLTVVPVTSASAGPGNTTVARCGLCNVGF